MQSSMCIIPEMAETAEDAASPTLGLSVSLEDASKVLQKHLGLKCTSVTPIERGFNNLTTVAIAEDRNEYIIRLSGRFWTRIKTEGEVAAIVLLREKFPSALPLPKILGFCSQREFSVIGYEYILMERLKGKPLDEVWASLEISIQHHVLDQIASIVAKIKSMEYTKIGSFCLNSNYEDLSMVSTPYIDIGEIVGQNAGPFNDYISYYVKTCEVEIEVLKTCDFMQPMLEYLPRIRKLLQALTDGTVLSKDEIKVPFVFHHGDFEFRNILVNDKSGDVTGLLDFEFSGSLPADNDWFDGFSDFGANTSQDTVLLAMGRQFDKSSSCEETEKEEKDNHCKYFLSRCKVFHKSLLTPSELPGHMKRAKLFYLMSNICPWFLRADIKPVPSDWIHERCKAVQFVDFVLTDFNF